MERRSDARALYQPNDFIALAMGEVAASRLTPSAIEAFRKSIARKRAQVGDNRYYQAWDEIISRGASAIRQVLVEPSERGQVLRSVISFRAFMTREERDEIFRDHVRVRAAKLR